jgi:hypothetical protein
VWLRRGLERPAVLDGMEVAGITPALDVRSRVSGLAHRLVANAGRSFQGSIVLGLGFVLHPDEAAALIEHDPATATEV